MKPKLYQYSACPFCSKVSTMLALKGVEYEAIEVHPLKKTEISFSTEYQKVPIYIDSQGKQINDSTEIMRHIDQDYPKPAVFASTEELKVEEEKWLNWSESYVQGLPTVIYSSFPESLNAFDYITKVGKFTTWEKLTVKFSGAFIMSLVAKKIAKRLGIFSPKEFLTLKVKEWSSAVSEKPFLGGAMPGSADVAVFGISRVVFDLKAGEILKSNPVFMSWLERMSKSTGLSLSKLTRP